jgi:clan AA aspartic protease
MGITYIEGTVSGPSGKRATLEFLVDSGAKYTLLPLKSWKAIGLKPVRLLTFVLADGTKVQRDVSECYIDLVQGKTHTPVVLGRSGDEALLGAVTLEELGLVLNPFQRSLQPAKMMLA